jgi:hypothetical protein
MIITCRVIEDFLKKKAKFLVQSSVGLLLICGAKTDKFGLFSK